MKRICVGLIACAAIGLLSSKTVAADPVVLRFSSFEPPVAFITKQILTPWAERVTADSGGALKIEMFTGGTLGRDPAGQLKLVIDGVADIAWIVPGYTPGRFDVTSIVELPFLAKSAQVASITSWRMYEKGYWKGGGFDDVKVLCVCSGSPDFVNTVAPAKDMADLKNRKIRTLGPIAQEVVKALGGVPVGGISGPQLAENLSRSLIEGAMANWSTLETFRSLEVVKNAIVMPLGSASLMVVMNKAKYESLPPAAKAAIDKHSGEAFSEFFGGMFDKNNQVVFDRVKNEKGRTIVRVGEEQQKPWRQAVQPIYETWKKSIPNGDQLFTAFMQEATAIENNSAKGR